MLLGFTEIKYALYEDGHYNGYLLLFINMCIQQYNIRFILISFSLLIVIIA